MKVKGKKVFVDGVFQDDLTIETKDENIEAISSSETSDLSAYYVIPGFVDLHFHGCLGADMCDGKLDSLTTMARHEASVGVTSICPATMTFSEEILTPIITTARKFKEKQLAGELDDDLANFVGINMEGPYISPQKVGAQNPEYVHVGDYEEFKRLQELSGNQIKIVDVAPEVDGNIEFIWNATCDKVVVSIAHTCADYDECMCAFAHGARHMTHLFNAMNPIHHRSPGPVVAAFDKRNVTAELICDGIHSHPAIIRMAFELFGSKRLVLISDTMRACGLDDGVYDLGGQDVTVKGSLATIADGSIAGSVTNLADCVRFAHKEAKIPLEDAIKCATQNPAKVLGLASKIGSIKCGNEADILLLNEDLELEHVILRGKIIK